MMIACLCSRSMSSCCTTAHAQNLTLIQLGNTFTTKARSIDTIPPTRGALLQHTKRAVYQGGHVWGQALVRCPVLPSPETCGWQKSATQGWQPLWTVLPEAVASCSELLRCGCQKSCRGLCKCVRAALKCTSLCHCSGNCDHNESN